MHSLQWSVASDQFVSKSVPYFWPVLPEVGIFVDGPAVYQTDSSGGGFVAAQLCTGVRRTQAG
jgi:hypothetical protein